MAFQDLENNTSGTCILEDLSELPVCSIIRDEFKSLYNVEGSDTDGNYF